MLDTENPPAWWVFCRLMCFADYLPAPGLAVWQIMVRFSRSGSNRVVAHRESSSRHCGLALLFADTRRLRARLTDFSLRELRRDRITCHIGTTDTLSGGEI